MDYSPPGSSVHGISQPRLVEWVAICFSSGSFWHRGQIIVSCTGSLPLSHQGRTKRANFNFFKSRRNHDFYLFVVVVVLVAKSCLTFCNPMVCSPQGSSAHGIFQARIVKWVATFYSRGSSQPRDWNRVSYISCSVCIFCGKLLRKMDKCSGWTMPFAFKILKGRMSLSFFHFYCE